MTEELALAQRLAGLGCAVGRSKAGRILRVDNRQCDQLLELEMLTRIIECRSLRELYLRNTRGFLNENIREISTLGSLKVLDVEGSDLTDESLACLSECPSLTVLNVRNTGVSEGQIAQLRKRMINTRIIA